MASVFCSSEGHKRIHLAAARRKASLFSDDQCYTDNGRERSARGTRVDSPNALVSETRRRGPVLRVFVLRVLANAMKQIGLCVL